MKNIISILILIIFINSEAFAQVGINDQKDSVMRTNTVKKIKSTHLSKQQKKQVKKYIKSNKAKAAAIKNNSALTEQQKKNRLAQLKKEKTQMLQAILTPEQKEKMKQMKQNEPRRGVTNMPNERTAK